MTFLHISCSNPSITSLLDVAKSNTAKKINRDRDDRWEDEHKREQMYQREAIRELRQNQAKVV